MKKQELNYLSKKLFKEKILNERIKELEKNPDVVEYKKLIGIHNLKVKSEKDLLFDILRNYSLTSTNNIWIVINSFTDKFDHFEEDSFSYKKALDLFNQNADGRIYTNLESLDSRYVYFNNQEEIYNGDDFEYCNLILNPFDGKKEQNGFNEVRCEFVLNAINLGEEQAKEKLLRKYKRIK